VDNRFAAPFDRAAVRFGFGRRSAGGVRSGPTYKIDEGLRQGASLGCALPVSATGFAAAMVNAAAPMRGYFKPCPQSFKGWG